MRMLASAVMPATAQIMLLWNKGSVNSQSWRSCSGALVEDVELLRRGVLLQQLASDLSLRRQDDAIFCQDTKSCAGMGNSF